MHIIFVFFRIKYNRWQSLNLYIIFLISVYDDSPLIVELVDLRISANTKFHYTDCFYLTRQQNPRLVVRRGAAVKLNLTLNRKFDADKDVLCLVFTLKGMHLLFMNSEMSPFFKRNSRPSCQSSSRETILSEKLLQVLFIFTVCCSDLK